MGKYEVGNRFTNRYGTEYEIIEYINPDRRLIKFLDNYGFIKEVNIMSIKGCKVKNPYDKRIFGVGMLGEISTMESLHIKSHSYNVWREVIRRVYNEKERFKFKSYGSCHVCEEWLIYANFKLWYDTTYPIHIKDIKFNLDKDLLQQNIENKVYSPETCIWLPEKINKYLVNFTKENTGSSFDKDRNKWQSSGTDFYTNKTIHYGRYNTKEEATYRYKLGKNIQNKNARDYLRRLNYLKDEIIDLIK